MPDLTGATIAFLATDGVEQTELAGPWEAIKAAGANVHLLSNVDQVQGFDHLDKAQTFDVDRHVDAANPSVYDALVLPGGVANPDQLRTDPQAVAFAKAMLEGDKVVAAICHAPWLLVEADLVRGRQVTSWPSLKVDLSNAGASWLDQEVVVDEAGPGTLITSRNPGDVPAFSAAVIDQVSARRNVPSR